MKGLMKFSSLLVSISSLLIFIYTPVVKADTAHGQIIQAVIDMKELQMYYHIDSLPERSPLILVKDKFTKDLNLKKFNKDVLLIEKQQLKKSKKPYIEFIKIDISNNSAMAEFIYPVEGIHGAVNLSQIDRHWRIKSATIKER